LAVGYEPEVRKINRKKIKIKIKIKAEELVQWDLGGSNPILLLNWGSESHQEK
jgi:hypothetical protein